MKNGYGFSVVELLVATAITAAGIAVMTNTFNVIQRSTQASSQDALLLQTAQHVERHMRAHARAHSLSPIFESSLQSLVPNAVSVTDYTTILVLTSRMSSVQRVSFSLVSNHLKRKLHITLYVIPSS